MHEFSCLHTGLHYIKNQNTAFDGYFLCTSALMNKPNEHLHRLSANNLLQFMNNGAHDAMGLLDSFGTDMNINGMKIDYWIRSNFIVLKQNVVDALNYSLPFMEFELHKTINCQVLDINVDKWINNHQNYTDAAEDIKQLRKKCIIYEKVFTALLLSLNFNILNVKDLVE